MRVLMGFDELNQRERSLEEIYAVPRTPWLRANMVTTLDGAATGSDGRSGSINDPADREVFATLRRLADAVIVGAGTARAESYGPAEVPLVLVSRKAAVPPALRDLDPGRVLMATVSTSDGLAAARELLGEDNVLVCGQHRVDLALLRGRLVARGWSSLLAEGGPHLLRDLFDQGVADELCATIVPRLEQPARRGRSAPAARPVRPGRRRRALRDDRAAAGGGAAAADRGRAAGRRTPRADQPAGAGRDAPGSVAADFVKDFTKGSERVRYDVVSRAWPSSSSCPRPLSPPTPRG